MEKTKKYFPYLASALFVAGLVVAVGFTVNAQSGGALETIKDAVIALTAKVLNVETRVVALEENTKSTDSVGGVTNFDQVDVAWVNTGDVASTTTGIWHATPVLESRQADGRNTDFWRNNTGGNVMVGNVTALVNGLATSTQSFYVATSSTPTLNNYTFAPSTVSAKGMRNALLQQMMATSTGDAVYHTSTSTVSYAMLRPGESIVLHIMATANNDKQCGAAGGTEGKCAAATSTARGYDILVNFDVFATSTPLGQF